MPFACIYVPNFPVAAALRAEPELQTHPVAILEGTPPLEKIIAVNENTKSLGIAPGMTKAQAELCSELALRPRSPQQESSTHAALLDCAQSFSPVVEDAACDTVLLDLAGMESLFGSLTKIAHAIADRAAALGLRASVAVASNPDAALLAARGFYRVTVIPPGKEAEKLGSLPVDVLFAGHQDADQQKEADCLLETLARWGIRNLCALAALPEVSLSERLGQQGLRLQRLARGAVTRALVPVEAPLIFAEAIELEHPIVLLEPLAFLLNRLLEQLCARLASRALATQELRLSLELSNLTGVDGEFETAGIPSESDGVESHRAMWGQPPKPALSGVEGAVRRSEAPQHHSRPTKFTRTLSLPLPLLDAKVFLKLLQLDLNAHPPGAPITKIHLSAEPARPRSAQGGLFLPPSPEPEKLELTLARIAGIVGEQKVGAVELLDTHHPEGFRMRRFVAEVARKTPPKKTPDATEAQAAVTALRRFRPPLRANVTLENGQPMSLVCRKKEVQGEVLWKAGPWRFSGDWWEREAWSRDEWDLALRNGEAVAFYRLVHDLLGGGWFIEGTYD
ncbi:MAG TPA: DNA polymerase Y family protein [Candidatus Dormibacteraeota bacterium]|nr:DNA polymerase Y family protein [Candidatus Dormibacteraeota bacterium]